MQLRKSGWVASSQAAVICDIIRYLMRSAGFCRVARTPVLLLFVASLASLLACNVRERSGQLFRLHMLPAEPDPWGMRVLAVITGAWTLPKYNTTARKAFLHHILQRYVHACEVGYDVQVVLSTYTGWDYNSWLDLQLYFCSRTMSTLPVRVVQHEIEPLPIATAKRSHGVVGTLAFKPRLIFTEERNNFDLFISQEDDVGIEAHHMSYFLKWAKFFEGTNFYPGFGFFELPMGHLYEPPKDALERTATAAQVMLNFRFRSLYLYRYRGIDFISFTGNNSGCCMYMLTQAMLLEESNQSDWLDSWHTFEGEFNAFYNSRNWLSMHRRHTIPVADLHRSIFDHLPHKYLLKYPTRYLPFEALLAVLRGCTDATLDHERERVQPGLNRTQIFDPNFGPIGWAAMCNDCLNIGRAIKIEIYEQLEGMGPRNATHRCIHRRQVKWVGYPRNKTEHRTEQNRMRLDE